MLVVIRIVAFSCWKLAGTLSTYMTAVVLTSKSDGSRRTHPLDHNFSMGREGKLSFLFQRIGT